MRPERYLDPKRSFIISSPAGSGKTEKLARRYISLVNSGAEVERVLAITFTEKAASEMKERILRIIHSEDPALYARIKPRIPLMRISTIHSFCLKLLTRFSMELGLDPSEAVMDEGQSTALWQDSVAEALREEAAGPGTFFQMMRSRGIRNWDGLFAHLDELFKSRPLSELVITERAAPGPETEEGKLLFLYGRCMGIYTRKKAEAKLLDFSDLETYAWRALEKSPEWQNILYSFDEHTDHILVDEFQDTSTLQWRIIDKLTEEWRSGLGAKRDRGTVPTIFLVGDEKQSIYLFRGADVSVMKKAAATLSGFLGDEYEFQEVKDNFRSLPEIISFTNCLFEKLMPRGLFGPEEESLDCGVEYSGFEPRRTGEGRIELLLLDAEKGSHTKENREREARLAAKYIKTLRRKYKVYQKDGTLKLCDFEDMAVLLRQRTHLAAFEDAFRREGVPFVVLKGMGFYDEPEVALLREFASFIADPEDDYALFCLLRSPLFGIDPDTLAKLRAKKRPFIEGLRKSRNKKLKGAGLLLDAALADSGAVPLSRLIERTLAATAGWERLWEKQRHANVKKFIGLVEALEAGGAGPIAVRDKLLAERFKAEVPKANVNAEGMDAVKLMTVHAAKGLQFPMVFLPSLDEDISPGSPATVIERSGEGFVFRYEPDSPARKEISEFDRRRRRELEEEKRLFYVAVTRARDFLFMSGFDSGKPSGRLAWLGEAFDFEKPGLPLMILREDEIIKRHRAEPAISLEAEARFLNEPVYTEPLDFEPRMHVRDVTEDILVKTRHGKDWVLIGRIIHQVLEEVSKGLLPPGAAGERARALTAGAVFDREKRERIAKTVASDLAKLEKHGFMREIVLPRENSFAELPFAHERGRTVFNGRIDRLIIKEGAAFIYDYKSFPVKMGPEMDELVEKYRFQMELYREAAEEVFRIPARAFLVFTNLPLSVEV